MTETNSKEPMKTHLPTLPKGNGTCARTEPKPGRNPLLALLMRLLCAAALVVPVVGAQGGVVFTTLHSFTGLNDGWGPGGLVRGSDAYFYGTTWVGGANGDGTVFKINTAGAYLSLYSFTGGNDGANPGGALVQGSDGYLYGTTHEGGGYGTVFKINTNGALTTLYAFGMVTNATGEALDGANPEAALVESSGGYFYGTTWVGGTNGDGTVFKINTNGALTTLYSFTGGNDGAYPVVQVQGSDGNVYGTTDVGGTNGGGTVFKISSNGAFTTLYSFTGGNDGAGPNDLVQGSDGNLYGTTLYQSGGVDTYNVGTVFRISTNGSLTTLYSFTDGNDGAQANGLVQGSDGSFYGTTSSGVGGAGTVFRLTILLEPPQLTIIPSAANVVLTWPITPTGFTLQSTTNLGSLAVWNTNSSPPVVIGGENVVINTISGRQQFYRLSQ